MKTAGVLPLALAESTCCFSRALTKAAHAIDRRVRRSRAHRIFTSAITGKGSELRVGGAPCRRGRRLQRAYPYPPTRQPRRSHAQDQQDRPHPPRADALRGLPHRRHRRVLQGGLLWRGVTAAGCRLAAPAGQPARPQAPGRDRQRSAAVRPHRRRDDGEPLLRQPARARCAARVSRRPTGCKFDHSGGRSTATPGRAEGPVRSFAIPTTAQAPSVTQTWNATHSRSTAAGWTASSRSVDCDEPMGYWTEDVLPFAYSFARTFTLANRWFCSAPCQTYPNRRFLMAGTAYGDIATDTESLQGPAAAERHDLRPAARLRGQLAQLLHRPSPDGDHPLDHREIPDQPRADRPVLL